MATRQPKFGAVLTAAGVHTEVIQGAGASALATSVGIYKRPQQKTDTQTDRRTIAHPWQIEAYRQVNICGEARYAAMLFASLAARAEIGVSEPQTISRKAVWVTEGPEVDAFAEVAPTVRERTKLVRDYMLHRVIAGECYLISRTRVQTDPGYIMPPNGPNGEVYENWDTYLAVEAPVDAFAGEEGQEDPNEPIWEIVAVTELRKIGDKWEVKHDNGNFLKLSDDDPIIRLWTPDPENRREAWSPFRSLIPTMREIEWLTAHIFRQVRSRLMSAGVWFVPNNITFPPPPPDAVQGGAEAIAEFNEAQLFMASLAASGMYELDADDVNFPTIVMADPSALEQIDQKKLIQFWSEIDDKAMTMRSDAVRRFALGMDLPPEQVIGSSGIAVTGSAGSAGSVNHWGVWANEEQTIVAHIEPALDDFVGVLTVAILRTLFPETQKVIGYDTATLRLRQDRSKESIELYDRGLLKGKVALSENGFDPESDMMDEQERKIWLLTKIASGSATPDQIQKSLELLGVALGLPLQSDQQPATRQPTSSEPRSLDGHPYEGPPREQHDHTPAPYAAELLACEALVLRALEKKGNTLLNAGKRGKDRDRFTPSHLAHLSHTPDYTVSGTEFDFSLAPMVLSDLPALDRDSLTRDLGRFCANLYQNGEPYTRNALLEALNA